MPQIIYRKSAASPWVKQGDRLTKTFSSGLCLIQQTYVAPKSLATYDAFVEGAAITDSQPCIDGAYIFPAPDYQDTGDGFMRCTVTAYGRWKTDPAVSRRKKKITLGVSGSISNMDPIILVEGEANNPITVFFKPSSYYLNSAEVLTDDLVLKFIVPATQSNLPLSPPISLARIYKITGEQFPEEIDIFYLQTFFGGNIRWGEDNGVEGFSLLNTNDFESNFFGYNSFDPMQNGISLNLASCESVEYGRFHEYTATYEASGNSFTKLPFIFRKK
jgi:hypothetical protein